ncbi:hypothetical protein JB92DRAFT_2801526 [Gautieria morchelliformis]|nr:hypothetical protein JB92DRAFT_2801526 [Gautieria morchelliformis]
MPPLRSAAFERLRKPYDRPTPTAPRNGTWVHDRAPVPVHPAAPSTRLIVSNLHWEVTVKDLISIFSTIGTLAREPVIRFDRSGRSTGVASITYLTPAEATRAKNQLDGKIAKTQAMAITYDTSTPRIPPGVRAAARNGSPDSLLNRVSKPPLLSRLSSGDPPTAPAAILDAKSTRPRPVARGARGGVRPSAPRVREPKKEKTAEELDKELEMFMGNDGKENGDVDMS